VSSFIANPQIIDYVKIDTSLEINLQKLNQLRDFQIKNTMLLKFAKGDAPLKTTIL